MLGRWNLLALAYLVGGLGAFITIAAGSWDITRHALGQVDTFFTTAHLFLYAGVGMAALAALGNVYLRWSRQGIPAYLLTGLDFVAFGSAIQLCAGPFDLWWHSRYGFDPVLLSPPHALLILGIALNSVGFSLGFSRLYAFASTARPENSVLWSPSLLKGLTALVFAAMWTSLNGVIYLFSIDFFTRSAPTSIITTPAALLLLASTAPLVLFTASRFVKGFGYITLIGALFMAVNILANLIPRLQFPGFTQFAIFYPIFILPIVLTDFLLSSRGNTTTAWNRLLAGAILGFPTFAFYFPMTFPYWPRILGGFLGASLILALPDALFGALGAMASETFYNFFSQAVPRLPILSSIGMKPTQIKAT